MNLSEYVKTYLYSTEEDVKDLLGMVVYYETCNTRGVVLEDGIGKVSAYEEGIIYLTSYSIEPYDCTPIYIKGNILYNQDLVIPLWRE